MCYLFLPASLPRYMFSIVASELSRRRRKGTPTSVPASSNALLFRVLKNLGAAAAGPDPTTKSLFLLLFRPVLEVTNETDNVEDVVDACATRIKRETDELEVGSEYPRSKGCAHDRVCVDYW